MAQRFAEGSQAWVKGDKDAWNLATVRKRYDTAIKLEPEGGGKAFRMDIEEDKDKVFPANSAVVADMTSLQFFHVPGILHNLKERSVADEPYTFLSGSVLVAVNPLRRVPDPEGVLGNSSAVSVPHPYAISESAFQQLVFGAKRKDSETPVNQSVIVGGESGAGKTESSKYVLKHLVSRCASGDDDDLDQRLIESNPILEAFGNAATKRNHNSSRFGKFMKIHYNKPGKKDKAMKIFGASVNTYLLERSRVTYHVTGERTYHVFYQLVHGAGKKMRKKLKMEDVEFDFLTPKKPADAGGPRRGKGAADTHSSHLPSADDDKGDFKELCKALGTIGVYSGDGSDLDGDEEGLFALVAAILHLGNVKVKDKDTSEGNVASMEGDASLETAAKLLDIKASKLATVLTEVKVKTVREELTKKRDARGAKYALDAVVKYLYVSMFEWLVQRITASLSEKGDLDDLPFIGVLDIFGFETFKVNDFEQLLINFTNEALQSCFNQQIFQAEAQLYEREGLLVDDGDRQMPPDNLECVALLQGGDPDSSGKKKKKDKGGGGGGMGGGAAAAAVKLGVLGMIDAEGKNPQANDDKLNSALQRAFKNHAYFPAPHPKDARTCFIVKHYAGDVKYTVGSFLEKNTDNLPSEVGKVFKSSGLGVIQAIFEKASSSDDSGGKGKKPKSVSAKFKSQMETLIEDLNATRCAFIRCIKPNASMTRNGKKDKSWFDPTYVLPQLINLSIPQTAEVLRGGLPTRVEFSMFIESYSSLLPSAAIQSWETLGGGDDKLFVKALFYAFEIPTDAYKVGHTRVFFKSGMLETVNEVLAGAMSGKKLDKNIAKRFKASFARALWRRALAKAIAVGHFNQMLQTSRERQSAITILQRLARRRMEMLEAKAELEELRKQRDEEKRKRAEAKAKEEQRRLKELKKQKKAATSAKAAEKLELELAIAEEKANESSNRAKHLSMRHLDTKKKEDEMRRSVRRSVRLTSEIGKAALALEDESKSRRRISFRRSTARGIKGGIFKEQEEDEEEEEPPFVLEQGVCFKLPQQGKPRAAGRSRVAASRPVSSASQPSYATDASDFDSGRSRSSSKASSLMCFSKMFRKKSASGRHLSEAPPRAPGAAAQRSHSRTSEMSEAKDAEEDLEEDKDDTRGDDGWEDCLLTIQGFQLRYYRDSEETKDGFKGKGPAAGTHQIDTGLALKPEPVQQDGVQVVAVVAMPTEQPLVKMRFEDHHDVDQFQLAFDRARHRYEYELKEAMKFETGELTAGMVEYQHMYDKGLISQAEFEMALAQQLASDDQFLDQLVGEFGEDAYADYKIQCNSCYEFLFNLPAEPLEECPHCGNPELDSPEQIERESRLARLQIETNRNKAFESSRNTKQSNFPFHLQSGEERYSFDKPQITTTVDRNNGCTVHLFTMDWHRRVGDSEWEDFIMSNSWEDYDDFFRNELGNHLSEDQAKKLPAFPDGDSDHNNAEDHYQSLLPKLTVFLLELLAVAGDLDLFAIKEVRVLFGMSF